MDLESTFYLVGIIFMVMMIGLLLTIAYFLTKVQNSINSVRENIAYKAKEIRAHANDGIAGIAGGLVTSFILSRVKNMFKKKRSDA